MTKSLKIVALVAVSMMGATQAFAQAATQDVDISATVPGYCRIAGADAPGALAATVPVDQVGVVDTTAIPFSVTGVVCNTATDVQVSSQSGGVKGPATAPSGFSKIIDYTGSATLGSATSSIDTSTAPAAASVETGAAASTAGAVAGNLSVSVTPQTPANPLVAGAYTDTLRVTLTPQ
jgi:hypothetical protein